MKRTPGPWKVRGNRYNRIWATVEGPNGEEVIWQSGPYQTLAIFVSDARLIAAVPEMLELIERAGDLMIELESLIDMSCSNDASAQKSQWHKDAAALLAKIKGDLDESKGVAANE